MATHKCPQNCPSPKFLSGLSPSYDLVSAEAPLDSTRCHGVSISNEAILNPKNGKPPALPGSLTKV